MIRNTIYALGLLGLSSTLAIASPISLGAMADYSVFSSDGFIYNNHYSTSGTTTINDGQNAGSRFNFGGTDYITFNGGGTFGTVTFGGTEYTDFHALTTSLGGLAGTPIVSWAGLAPGNYTFTTAPTTVSLTTPGTYTFSYVGGSPLAFNGVDISLGSGLSSDDVFWYVPADVSVTNSNFGGVLVVDGYGATVEANGASTVFQGRVLAESTISLTSWNDGGNLSFNTQTADSGPSVPEPSTFLLVFPALAACAIARRRVSLR